MNYLFKKIFIWCALYSIYTLWANNNKTIKSSDYPLDKNYSMDDHNIERIMNNYLRTTNNSSSVFWEGESLLSIF